MNTGTERVTEKVESIRSWIGQLALVGSDLVVERKINELCDDILKIVDSTEVMTLNECERYMGYLERINYTTLKEPMELVEWLKEHRKE